MATALLAILGILSALAGPNGSAAKWDLMNDPACSDSCPGNPNGGHLSPDHGFCICNPAPPRPREWVPKIKATSADENAPTMTFEQACVKLGAIFDAKTNTCSSKDGSVTVLPGVDPSPENCSKAGLFYQAATKTCSKIGVPLATDEQKKDSACDDSCHKIARPGEIVSGSRKDGACHCLVDTTTPSELNCRKKGLFYQAWIKKCDICPIGKSLHCGKCECPEGFIDLGKYGSCACPKNMHAAWPHGLPPAICVSNNPAEAARQIAALTAPGDGCGKAPADACGGTP